MNTTPEHQRRSPALATPPPPASDIVYTQTPRVLVDEAVLEEHRLIAHKDDQYGNAFRVLRSQIIAKMQKDNLRSIAIVGAVPEVGKTMVSTNLALSFSRDKRHTALLMDLDLRRPRVADYFGFEVKKGMAEVLLGSTDFASILKSPFDRLVVAPGTPNDNVGELLSLPTLPQLIEEVRTRYDDRITVIDLPPLLGIADALEVLPLVDCVLMVLEGGKTTKAEITEMKRLLAGTTIIGAVVNKSQDDRDHGKTYYNYYSHRD